ncbi:UNVERIFIED_CONTAM: hypothetical protein HDU68_008823 [Siphonaria sp. JEL0065]|nr:hypothetical protein HDU68_008823 [Siphonaria sp. JEL0065]
MSLLFRQPVNHFVSDKKDETIVFEPESFPSNATLYFKNVANSTITINAPCTKVFIEGCDSSTFTFSSRIVTQMLEVWKSSTVIINLNTPVLTIQADQVNGLNVVYSNKEHFETLVWTKSEGIHLVVAETVVDAGFESSKEIHKGQYEIVDTDQFIIRFVGGILKSEVIVRIGTGFPTTAREDDAYLARETKNLNKLAAVVREDLTRARKEKILREIATPVKKET